MIQPNLGDLQAVLFNADGRQVKAIDLKTDKTIVTIFTSDLPVGHYFLQITGTQTTSTYKIVKL